MATRTVEDSTNWDTPLLAQFLVHFPFVPQPVFGICGLSWQNVRKRAQDAHRAGYYLEAERLHELGLAIARRNGPHGVYVAHTLNSLGVIAERCGAFQKAEERLQGALSLFEHNSRSAPGYIASTLANLGVVYGHLGVYPRAEAMLERSIFLLGGIANADVRYILPLNDLALVRTKQGRYTDAAELWTKMRQLIEQTLDQGHHHLGLYYNNMGYLYFSQQQYEDAECAFMKALCIYMKTLRPGHPRIASPCFNWANLHLKQGRYSAAEALLRRGIRIQEHTFGVDSRLLQQPLEALALALRKLERESDAEAIEARLKSIEEFNADW